MQTAQLIITGTVGKTKELPPTAEQSIGFQGITFRSEDTQLTTVHEDEINYQSKGNCNEVKLPVVEHIQSNGNQPNNKANAWKSPKKGKDLPPNQQLIIPAEIGGVGSVEPAGPALASFSEGRLKNLARVSTHNRKVVSMLNDQMKERCQLENHSIDRIQKQVSKRLSQAQIPVKKSLDDLNDVKCSLAEVASAELGMEDAYGRYGGKTVREAQVIAQVRTAQLSAQQLREKRYQKVQSLLGRGITSGKLIDGQELVRRLRDLTDKPFPEIKLRPKTVKNKKSNFLLPSLTMGLQTVNLSDKGYGNFHVASTSTFVGMPLVQKK